MNEPNWYWNFSSSLSVTTAAPRLVSAWGIGGPPESMPEEEETPAAIVALHCGQSMPRTTTFRWSSSTSPRISMPFLADPSPWVSDVATCRHCSGRSRCSRVPVLSVASDTTVRSSMCWASKSVLVSAISAPAPQPVDPSAFSHAFTSTDEAPCSAVSSSFAHPCVGAAPQRLRVPWLLICLLLKLYGAPPAVSLALVTRPTTQSGLVVVRPP